MALVLYPGYTAAAILASFPAGQAADRFGDPAVLLAGVALFAAAYVGFALAGISLAVAVAFVTAGVAIGLVETAEHAAVAAFAPAEVRGSAFGVLAAVQSFGNLAALRGAGLLWNLAWPTVAFVYAAGWMAPRPGSSPPATHAGR